MQYDRKIKYFDYYEHGERIKSGGFVKLIIREEILRLELTIRGLHPTDSFVRDVILVGMETEEVLGQITIEEGNGCFKYTCRMEQNIGSTNIPYEELREIRIPVGGSRELCCTWGKKSTRALSENGNESMMVDRLTVEKEPEPPIANPLEQVSQTAESPEPESQEMAEQVTENPETASHVKETVKPQIPKPTDQEDDSPQEGSELQAMWSRLQPDTDQEDTDRENADREDRKPVVKLLEDKWEQLSAIYPHIRPFEDDREYISLSPSDFVLFPAKYYRAANNSFLLHGYYNYKHLILVRVERRGEALYYLGVPGNYFDREKQVAVMFGFESFECAQEPARTGDFGYYMMRTEL